MLLVSWRVPEDRSIKPGEITLELGHELLVFLLVIGNVEHAGDLLMGVIAGVHGNMEMETATLYINVREVSREGITNGQLEIYNS